MHPPQCPEQEGCKAQAAATLSAQKTPKGFGSPSSSSGATLPAQASVACGHPGAPHCTVGLWAPTSLQPPHSGHHRGSHLWAPMGHPPMGHPCHTFWGGDQRGPQPMQPTDLICVCAFGVGVPPKPQLFAHRGRCMVLGVQHLSPPRAG